MPEKKSLIDFIAEKADTINSTCRVVVVGSLSVSGKSSAERKQQHRSDTSNRFQQFVKGYTKDQVTGMLLINGNVFISVFESTENMVAEFVKFVGMLDLVKDISILSSMDNVPYRWFPVWFARILEGKNSDMFQENEEEPATFEGEQLVNIVLDVVTDIKRLGEAITQLPKDSLKNALNDLQVTYKTMIPKPETIKQIAGNGNILSTNDWIKIYV